MNKCRIYVVRILEVVDTCKGPPYLFCYKMLFHLAITINHTHMLSKTDPNHNRGDP